MTDTLRIEDAWDAPAWPRPITVGKHRLLITRNSRTGAHRYYVDDKETDVNGYLAITGKYEAARVARLLLRAC
jgi:hypothetical protein